MNPTEDLAKALGTAMDRQNVTPGDLSRATGIPEARLSRHLAHPEGFRVGDFARVVTTLGVDPADLF